MKSAIESISASSLENIKKIDNKEAQETKYTSLCMRSNYKLFYVAKTRWEIFTNMYIICERCEYVNIPHDHKPNNTQTNPSFTFRLK